MDHTAFAMCLSWQKNTSGSGICTVHFIHGMYIEKGLSALLMLYSAVTMVAFLEWLGMLRLLGQKPPWFIHSIIQQKQVATAAAAIRHFFPAPHICVQPLQPKPGLFAKLLSFAPRELQLDLQQDL
jgi:hypothetical protein